jgi:NAD(P)-dependent dehydrogenase (short-subunit alcohol dehydrogenase family)
MALDLTGKTALITGAAGGIGLAVAQRLQRHGARLVLVDIRDSEGMTALEPAMIAHCNVAEEDQVKDLFARVASEVGKLHILVNNAGLTHLEGTIEDMSSAYFERMQAVNVNGVFYGLKYGQGCMHDGGSIINTASLAAQRTGPGYAAYSMSKAAVVSLTQTAAIELGGRGIRVNAVCPGHTRVDRPGMTEEEAQAVLHQCEVQCALGRIGEVDEQAAVFHFLAADESRYMTGQALIVDGGFSLGDTEALFSQLAKA